MITLATLDQATPQEVFDQAKNHLLTQNKKALRLLNSGDTRCAYRSPDGLKCAAGCFIADDEYVSNMEGMLWGTLVGYLEYGFAHFELIADLQSIHDQCDPLQWVESLQGVANKYNLLYEHE